MTIKQLIIFRDSICGIISSLGAELAKPGRRNKTTITRTRAVKATDRQAQRPNRARGADHRNRNPGRTGGWAESPQLREDVNRDIRGLRRRGNTNRAEHQP